MESKELFYLLAACVMLAAILWDSRGNNQSA